MKSPSSNRTDCRWACLCVRRSSTARSSSNFMDRAPSRRTRLRCPRCTSGRGGGEHVLAAAPDISMSRSSDLVARSNSDQIVDSRAHSDGYGICKCLRVVREDKGINNRRTASWSRSAESAATARLRLRPGDGGVRRNWSEAVPLLHAVHEFGLEQPHQARSPRAPKLIKTRRRRNRSSGETVSKTRKPRCTSSRPSRNGLRRPRRRTGASLERNLRRRLTRSRRVSPGTGTNKVVGRPRRRRGRRIQFARGPGLRSNASDSPPDPYDDTATELDEVRRSPVERHARCREVILFQRTAGAPAASNNQDRHDRAPGKMFQSFANPSRDRPTRTVNISSLPVYMSQPISLVTGGHEKPQKTGLETASCDMGCLGL